MSQAVTESPNPAATLTGPDERVLRRIFQHPLSHNLSWRETFALIKAIGAVDHAHNGTVVLTVGTDQLTFRSPRNEVLEADEVMALRHFLTGAGWALDAAASPPPASTGSGLVILIDPAGARIFPLNPDEEHAPRAVERGRNDANREATLSAEQSFFDAVAANVGGHGRIVVVGHGTDADPLMGYLAKHHSAVHPRVAREIVADLPNMTAPQLLRLARHALHPALKSTLTTAH